MAPKCLICKSNVLRHNVKAHCHICDGFCHIKCLPFINKNDVPYITSLDTKWSCIKCNAQIFPYNHTDDDDEFLSTLSENWFGNQMYIGKFENKLFQPFELNDEEEHLPQHHSDPDYQYFNEYALYSASNCKYHTSETFKKEIQKLKIDNDYFSIMGLNTRSVPRNFNKLKTYLETLEVEFTCIGLCETWFNNSNVDCYNLDGYNHESLYRKKGRGGGVSLFIKEGVEYKVRKDLTLMTNEIECIFIEIDKQSINAQQNKLVGMTYRRPSCNVNVFNAEMKKIYNKISRENKKIYSMGDFNINLFNNETHTPTAEFIDINFDSRFLKDTTF